MISQKLCKSILSKYSCLAKADLTVARYHNLATLSDANARGAMPAWKRVVHFNPPPLRSYMIAAFDLRNPPKKKAAPRGGQRHAVRRSDRLVDQTF